MASPNRSSSKGGGSDAEPPQSFANVPATTPMLDHSFLLQAMMEVQKSVGDLGAKTDRLVTEFDKTADRLDIVRGTLSFVKGACWVIGTMVTAAWALFLIYVAHSGKLP